MLSFLKFSKQANLANTYCKSKFKESLLFISPAVYLCFPFSNADVALVVVILLVDRHPDLMQVGTVPLHQTLSMNEIIVSWFQS